MTTQVRMQQHQVPAECRPYRPAGSALELMLCRAEEVVLSGAAGTGKSRGCLEKMHLCASKYAGMRGLIVRKTRASLTEAALVTYEDNVLPAGSPIKDGPQRRMRQAYHYPNGSEIVVGGLDKSQKVMSTEYDLIYVQESIELLKEDWENLTTRLRNGKMPYQQLMGDTNPDAPGHWLKARCDAGSVRMIHCRHEDNPRLYNERTGAWTPEGLRYLAKLERLTGARYLRLRKGLWVQSEGIVYEGWDPAVHLIDRFDIPKEWPRYRVIDFGYTNPFVCQWFAEDPDGRLYLYRELYRTQRTVQRHSETIRAAEQWGTDEQEYISRSIADHDAEDRATLAAAGIYTEAANKAVSSGIQAVQERLKAAGDGKPRLFILRDSLIERDEALEAAKKPFCTEQEFSGYVWEKAKDGKPVKESPVKRDDHGMDALRYLVVAIDSGTWQIGFV